jgi:hypothetical protein
VHALTLDGEVLDFGHSGRLYRSSFLLYDRKTKSLWHHLDGRALTGKMRGKKLETLPSQFVTWDVWRKTHPDTLVLAKNPSDRSHATDTYGKRNRELKLNFGLGITVGRARRLYEFTELERTTLVQERVRKVPVLVYYHPESLTAVAWDRRFGEKNVILDLRLGEEDESGMPLLVETGEGRSTFHPVTGEAVSGPLKGKRLRPILGSHWEVYAWMAHHPRGTTYRASVPPPVELPELPDPDEK